MRPAYESRSGKASEQKVAVRIQREPRAAHPASAIIGLTEMMIIEPAKSGTEKAQKPLQRVHRAGTHLLGLSNTLTVDRCGCDTD